MALLALADLTVDDAIQSRVQLNATTITEYCEAMRLGAIFPPVVAFYDGSSHWLADGFHRFAATEQAELEEIEVEVRQGTRRDALLFSVGSNATHGLRRTNADKRRAVKVLLDDAEWSHWSNREIARRCGVSHHLVNSLRSSLESDSSEKRTYTTKHGTQASMQTNNIGRPAKEENFCDVSGLEAGAEEYSQPSSASPISTTVDTGTVENDIDVSSSEEDVAGYGPDFDEAYMVEVEVEWEEETPDRLTTSQLLTSSNSNEWYSPECIVTPARIVLGGRIDLDPASCSDANAVIQAQTIYTKEQDGLSQPWFGNVWLNPPYGKDENSKSNAGKWSSTLIEKYLEQEIEAAILLVNAAIGRVWFNRLWDFPVCFPYRRIRFWQPGVKKDQPTFGNVIAYLGPNNDLFAEYYSPIGQIVMPSPAGISLGFGKNDNQFEEAA